MKDNLLKLVIVSAAIRLIAVLLTVTLVLVLKVRIDPTLNVFWCFAIAYLYYNLLVESLFVILKDKVGALALQAKEDLNKISSLYKTIK